MNIISISHPYPNSLTDALHHLLSLLRLSKRGETVHPSPMDLVPWSPGFLCLGTSLIIPTCVLQGMIGISAGYSPHILYIPLSCPSITSVISVISVCNGRAGLMDGYDTFDGRDRHYGHYGSDIHCRRDRHAGRDECEGYHVRHIDL